MLTFYNKEVFDTFVPEGEVVEMRIPKADGRFTMSGYFDCYDDFCRAIRQTERLNHSGVYFTLHCIDPRLIARACNHLKKADTTTADINVLYYKWLPVDIDPVRPSGISSSDSEWHAALALRDAVTSHVMKEFGLAAPIVASSGNGGHLLFRLPDIPVNEQNKSRIRGILVDLANKFDNSRVKIDTTVFNPARIWKLYGTEARKGDAVPAGYHREARPHRMAYIETLGGQQP